MLAAGQAARPGLPDVRELSHASRSNYLQTEGSRGAQGVQRLVPPQGDRQFCASASNGAGPALPPRSEERNDKAVTNQLTSITSGVYARAVEYRRERSLGVYGKAKLGNAFRWKLKELGYSDKFIDEVTHGLVLRISKGR